MSIRPLSLPEQIKVRNLLFPVKNERRTSAATFPNPEYRS
jgi:hypothetical protein